MITDVASDYNKYKFRNFIVPRASSSDGVTLTCISCSDIYYVNFHDIQYYFGTPFLTSSSSVCYFLLGYV